jgi:hypothetical protein
VPTKFNLITGKFEDSKDKKILELADSVVLIKGDKGDKGAPGIDGKDGINGKDGIDGKDGRDGRDGIDGRSTNGKDGIGISAINQPLPNKIEIKLTNGDSHFINLPEGQNPKQIELGTSATHFQWRYLDGEWIDLAPLPKNQIGVSGGGRMRLRDLQDMITAGSGVTITQSDKKLVIASTGSSSSIPLPGTVTYSSGKITGIALTGGNTYDFAYNSDNTIDTIDDGTYIRTFTYNSDGTIASWAIT